MKYRVLITSLVVESFLRNSSGGGQGGGSPRELGAGGVREERGEKAGSGIPKVAGTRRKYCVIFGKRNRTKKREPLRKGAGNESKRYRRREFQTPPVSPSHSTVFSGVIFP